MNRIIFHVDVNSAFLSWEAAKRVAAGQQDIRQIPSAVGGDKEKRTGIILAKSFPAKEFGVKTGIPVSMALRLCPSLTLVKPDFELYEKCSAAFMKICRRFSPKVEKYSIDECFLDMTGSERICSDITKAAAELKDLIHKELGFTVNVGIGPNKLLAKMAGDFEKPDKVHTLFENEIQSKMWPLPVDDLFMLGESSAEKLKKARIFTIGELAAAPETRIQKILGLKTGKMLQEFAKGIDNSQVSTVPDDPKGYSSSVTMETNVTEYEQADSILLSLTDSTAERMRMDGAETNCIAVTVKDIKFKNRSHQQQLSNATDITSEIYNIACKLIRELWNCETPLRLIGLSLSKLSSKDAHQPTLFPDEQKEKDSRLDSVTDAIRQKFGLDVLKRASTLDSGERIGLKYKAKLAVSAEEQKKEKKAVKREEKIKKAYKNRLEKKKRSSFNRYDPEEDW